MSRPQPGVYIIYNRVLSPTGHKLAITFHDEGNNQGSVHVTPKSNDEKQKWIVANFDNNTQSFAPESKPNLQISWGDGVASILPANNYVWTVKSSDSGYTIRDGKNEPSSTWQVKDAVDNANVAIAQDHGTEKQRWIFEKA